MSRRDEPAAGWVVTPLSELLTGIESGKSFQCEERPPVAGEVGVVKVSAVSWGEYREQESKTCTTADRVNADYFIRPGDFLFSRANTIELVGACVVARQVTLRVMLSDKILRLQFLWDDLKPWMLHFLSSKAGRLQIETLATGNQESMRNIGQERLGQILVPLPPQAEQARIVAKLEELLSELDAGVAELKAAQAKLKQYRQSLLKAAVEGTLTAEWRARNPPQETGTELLARILRERRARWELRQLEKFAAQGKAPPKDWQRKFATPRAVDVSDSAGMRDGWTWASIDELADLGTGVTPLRSNRQFFDGGDIPWVTSGALNAERVTEPTEYVTQHAVRQCRLEVYPAGALLVAMYGEGKTRGKCAELAIDAAINQAIAALVFGGASLGCRDYVKVVLWSSYELMRQQASGGVQPNLNLQIIKGLAVPLPPLTEQIAIIETLSTQLEGLQSQEHAITHGLRLAAAQRQNILRAAFAGQLVPQDPADEPASALLARIRAERAQRPAAAKRMRRSSPQPATP